MASLATPRALADRFTVQDIHTSLIFDGASNYLATPIIASDTGFSFGFWYKRLRYSQGGETVASNLRDGNGFSLNHDPNSKNFYFTTVIAGAYTYEMNFKAQPIGEWHHVAITAANAAVQGYLDGKLIFSRAGVVLPSSPWPVTFMANQAHTVNFTNGLLNGIVFQNNIAWNASQVRDVMNTNAFPGATAILKLDEGAGAIAYDASGYGNHATIAGAAFITNTPTKRRQYVDNNFTYKLNLSYTPPASLKAPVKTSGKWIDNNGGSPENIFGWGYQANSGFGEALIDTETRYSDQPTIKLATAAAGSNVFASPALGNSPNDVKRFGVAVLPNTLYTARVAIKAKVNSGASDKGAFLRVEEFNGNGVAVAANDTTYIKATANFSVYLKTFKTSANTRFLVPQAYLNGASGTGTLQMEAWFGGIEITKAATVAAVPGAPLSEVGICNPFSSYNNLPTIRSRCGVIKEAGFTWIRTDFRASIIEPQRGTFAWEAHDNMVVSALGKGLKILPILDYSVDWGNGGNTDTSYPWTDPQDYADFCAAVVARYAPMGVKHYELWNEPNISTFWKPEPNETQYAEHLQKAYQAIKAVDPTVTVIMGGITGDYTPDAIGPTYHGPFNYLDGVYDAIGPSYMDAIAYHPYTPNGWQEANTLGLRDIMVAHGDGSKKIWLTEYGRPSGGTAGQDFVTEGQQAQLISNFIRDARKYPWIGPVFLYNYLDAASMRPDREGYFGLIRPDNTWKPSFQAAKNAIKGIYL